MKRGGISRVIDGIDRDLRQVIEEEPIISAPGISPAALDNMRSLQEEFEALTPKKKKKKKKKKKDARAIEYSFTPKNGKLSQHREGIVLLETDLATSPPVSR
ncbi:hypothetical protein DTO063F5_1458 [Paecilomyces variotii]|nr:hypothetical protein DTO063F5_1458 [Paecilomyces variotii]